MPFTISSGWFKKFVLIRGKFSHQMRRGLNTKNGKIEKFFTPFLTTSYKRRETCGEHNFRIKRAGSSNYRGSVTLFSKWKLIKGIANAIRLKLSKLSNFEFCNVTFTFAFSPLKFLICRQLTVGQETEILYQLRTTNNKQTKLCETNPISKKVKCL